MHSTLSAYGVSMPGIIYGTAWKKELTASLVQQAITLGFRGIDTACQPKHYHEVGVGEAVSNCLKQGLSRSELYLQSKFTPVDGHDPKQIPYDKNARLDQQVAQSFQCSLKNLQTDYLDGLILHSPLTNQRDLLTVWQAMEQLFVEGGVKQLGISNCYNLEQFQYIYQSAKIKPAILQNRFYAKTHFDQALRTFCHTNNIIYQSFWTLTANPAILADALSLSLAEKYHRSVAQIFFRYLTQSGIIPLTGTHSANHMQEDLAIFEFELSKDESDQFDKLLIKYDTEQ